MADRGRPTIYNTDTAAQICARLSEGESLRSVCRDADMPGLSTVFQWLAKDNDNDFAEQYARAKAESADAYAEKITDVADGVLDGRFDPNAARVAMDGYKWTASRLKPKKYGDRQHLEHSGELKQTVEIVRFGDTKNPDTE